MGLFASKTKNRVGWIRGAAIAFLVITLQASGADSSEGLQELISALPEYETRGEWFALLHASERILEADPDNGEALRGRIVAADALGAPFVAGELALAAPHVLREADWHRLRGHQGALAVRWGRIYVEDPAERFTGTDRALEILEGNLRILEGGGAADAPFERQALFDRMAALRDRVRMEEVVYEYERLQDEGIEAPYYALKAAGDAYLYLRRPHQARDLYLQALETDPEPFETRLALFYAYVELRDFRRAFSLIDETRDQLPPWRHDGGPQPVPVSERTNAEVSAALARIFAEQPAKAQSLLEDLHALAPHNRDLQRELGNLYAVRGWPRRAEGIYRAGLAAEPRHRGLRIGLAHSALDLKEYGIASPLVRELADEFPEDREVRRLARWWENGQRRELRLDANGGRSTGTELGSRDLSLGATFFSSPFADHYRFFLSAAAARARFPEGDEIYRRAGAGVEYRRAAWNGSAELTYNVEGGRDLGARLAATRRWGDHWSVAGSAERFSARTPLRALRHDIRADAADLGVIYRHSESRRLELWGGVMDFSDGNLRRTLSAQMRQRVLSRPLFSVDGGIDLYASANRRIDTPYFNPERDASALATLEGTHRLYRRYERAFSHRLSVSAGPYRQRGFGTVTLASATYEHIWELGDRFDLLYGASRHRRFYDGEGEYHNRLHAALAWRF